MAKARPSFQSVVRALVDVMAAAQCAGLSTAGEPVSGSVPLRLAAGNAGESACVAAPVWPQGNAPFCPVGHWLYRTASGRPRLILPAPLSVSDLD